ncbi:hypothetical protein F4692_000118 [Nocardioides cavernae]|uniref:Uncharacterized protein n=1 Tax=Nocardioides cavernae TaxID=1921566 RepID=A0A7Y9GZ43_9ACTN|nr:hypothetical protein [Nocardioides cavernae]NYE35014.1 hypothetical protein [Nocardioides cavernae]
MSQPEAYDRSRTADRTVTVVEMLALALLVPFASIFGLFFGMASDGCIGSVQCSSEQITVGLGIAAVSPWVVYVAALVVVVVRWVRRRSTWWVPLAALVVGAALWAIGGFVAVAGAR